ncbi:MAG: ABC transporter permease, partial [Candidatus Hydrogenedentes bacterium]|nr:ABC transporter permease [Candidatus Hydrogenedentota bacterium]
AFLDLTIVTFRATAVTFLGLENPQTMTPYGWLDVVNKDGIVPFRKQCVFSVKDPLVAYIEPDERFYVKLDAGSPKNRLALVTRAFMLGQDDRYRPRFGEEIDGPGFLAADSPIIHDVSGEVAHSMIDLNGKRLALQNEYAMADSRVNQYHEKAIELLNSSRRENKSYHDAQLESRDAVTYCELNHPVLRESVSEAVLGILWYLGLLVPFCFFFEKLVFGFSDVRKQLLVHGLTFLVVFGLLRLLHPAFEMVQSSLMILLGFIIILISLGVILLFGANFNENLEGFRKRQGKVTAAQVRLMGVLASAFLLGLNNMHRRPVRTWLTCGSLVLMTFVVICFTTVQNDIVEEAVAVGKAPYQGILVKKKDFEELANINALLDQYGGKYDVCPRQMYVGQRYLGQSYNPAIEMTYQPPGSPMRRVEFGSIIKLAAAEPMRHNINFLTNPNWFTPEQNRITTQVCPVMIPNTIAGSLGISVDSVEKGGCEVKINGMRFIVRGIFDATSYQNLRDLDGFDLLPFDIEAIQNVVMGNTSFEVLAQDTDPRISADKIVICPGVDSDLKIPMQYGLLRACSTAVSMPAASYKEARSAIESYLERRAEPVFYGLGGVAFRGKRTRELSMSGILDLLLPLIIASLTVLNTMKGSVYERRGEIFVYNAVGIAPRYVFFMFFSEAAVYSVVGSVLGYVFSQGVGRILTSLDMTGGMNMTFASITTIYASLAIGGAVFLSTYFPARTAMSIAEPAEESGWKLPEPDRDRLRFRLPFMFNNSDRIAILAFCNRYLEDHGEGSSGRFFAAPPQISISDELDALANNAYIPRIACTIWLKPFDLAVAQEMILAVPTDEETGEYTAEITLRRLSGTRESWLRLNVSFVSLIRQHLLHWRVVNDEERREMFIEARDIIEKNSAAELEPAAGARELAAPTGTEHGVPRHRG